MNIKPKQYYVVRKYVLANSAKQAILQEHKSPVHDVWLDDKLNEQLKPNIGYTKSG